MHDLIYKIISYTQAKYRCTYNKWYIGLTDNPKETRKEFESKNKIICTYFKTWSCKNKTQARKILEEFKDFNFIICKKTPKPLIFIFLSVDKKNYKAWKVLNAPIPKTFLTLD